MPTTPRLRFFQGLPDALLPAEGVEPARWTVVHDGARNLAARPFDYRNPFPPRTLEEINAQGANGANTPAWEWPINDDPATFDYYVNGNAALGLPGGPENALVDHHGTLRAFTGAWAFALADGAAPPLRVRTLEDGHWPLVSAACPGYRFEYFACALPDAPLSPFPVEGNGSYKWVGESCPRVRNLFLWARVTADGPLHLAFAQQAALCAGAFYMKPAYAPAWENLRLEPVGDGRLRLLATHAGVDYTLALLNPRGATLSDDTTITHWPEPLPLAPPRPAAWNATMDTAGTVDLLVPFFPLPRAEDACLLTAEYNACRVATRALWQQRRAAGMRIDIPEAKVRDAFLQALNHLDLCSVTLGQSEFPTPGPTGGHHVFYERDNIDLIYAYDLIGEHDRAARMLEHYWLYDVNQETSGMVLWLLGRRLAILGDPAWARHALPEAKRRMSWLVGTWVNSRHEHDGLLPGTLIPDNELIEGHFVSYHLYAIAGARAAVALSQAAGETVLAAQWQRFLDEFKPAVLQRLAQLVEATDGVITPGFEGYDAQAVTVNVTWVEEPYSYQPAGAYGETGGCDWHNVGAAFPTGVLPAEHPWITSSLARWRHAYVEGIFPYPSKADYTLMHNYNTLNLTGTFLRRGESAEALRDLYGVLLHTTAAHASAEGVDTAGRRDFNCTPHNWFSGKLVRCIRDLLVYEDGPRLHLLAGLSPAWMHPGMTVGIANAPTDQGEITYRAAMRADGLDLTLDFAPRPAAEALVLHLPDFLSGVHVTADGTPVAARHHTWLLPVNTRQVTVTWLPTPLPDISFTRVVESYIADYKERIRSNILR